MQKDIKSSENEYHDETGKIKVYILKMQFWGGL